MKNCTHGVKKELQSIEKYIEMLERKLIKQSKKLEDAERELTKLRKDVECYKYGEKLRKKWANGEIDN